MLNNGSSKKKNSAQLEREIKDSLRASRHGARRLAEAPRSTPARSSIPSQEEYERREFARAQRQLEEIRRSPLADRKEAQAEFLEAMRERPEVVSERIGWLLDGNYGYGTMMLAKRVLASPRMNRSAALTQMIGALEWRSPEDMSRAAWKSLSTSQKARLESEVQSAIASAESEE